MTFSLSVEALFNRATKLDALASRAAFLAHEAWAEHAHALEHAQRATTMAEALRRCTGSISVTYDDGRGNVATSEATR
jgi:hypothetical protein